MKCLLQNKEVPIHFWKQTKSWFFFHVCHWHIPFPSAISFFSVFFGLSLFLSRAYFISYPPAVKLFSESLNHNVSKINVSRIWYYLIISNLSDLSCSLLLLKKKSSSINQLVSFQIISTDIFRVWRLLMWEFQLKLIDWWDALFRKSATFVKDKLL